MKHIFLYLVVSLFFISPTIAQENVDSVEAGPNPEAIIDAGMDELLSYLFLTREDFIFRDDFTERDSFRLAIVDSLMRHPLLMDNFADSFKVVLEGFEENPDGLMNFLYQVRDTVSFKSYHFVEFNDVIVDDSDFGFKLRKIKQPIRPLVEEIADTLYHYAVDAEKPLHSRKTYGSLDNLFDVWDEIVFIVNNYKETIIEDENYKNQTAEEMDSVQHLEEDYIKKFKEIAENLPEIEYLDVSHTTRLIDSLENLFISDKKLQGRSKPGKLLYEIKTEVGLIAIGSYGDDVYRGEYFMIFDPGGDDSYYLEYDISKPHPMLIADYGGNDFYKAETEFSLAAGAFSYSLLIDYAGDDIYRGGNFSLGCGYFGVGILWDKKGNDCYFGDTFTQGAGTFGLGLLIDSDGSDNYIGNLSCQGHGYIRGFGGIVDYSGNDTYTVQGKYPESFHTGSHYASSSQGFAIGARPYMSGGFGFLYDFDGNDVYVADYFCQAAAYWWSLGILYDNAGDDKYLSHQYAQGNGTHMALGYLRDNSGDDVYRTHSVSQGCGHDYSCGWLKDLQGDDIYSGHNLVQGAGQANGFGIFTDGVGDDGYFVFLKTNTQGYGNPRRDYGSIGIFLDGNGDDRYDGNGKNNFFWTIDSKWGGGLDKQTISPDSTEAK